MVQHKNVIRVFLLALVVAGGLSALRTKQLLTAVFQKDAPQGLCVDELGNQTHAQKPLFVSCGGFY